MDRLNQLRGEAGSSKDSTLDTSSPPSEGFITANESSSKYFSLSEVDSTFDISSIKDVSLPPTTPDTEAISEPDRCISNISPIGNKNDFLDNYKIGKQIEAANILSGGVDIFDDNDNSCDGNELVIDDNVDSDEKHGTEMKSPDTQYKDDNESLVEMDTVPSKDTEVILQIDGKNVDAIDIGNGLYLYRKEGQEELAAVQIDEDQQQPSFKFLKVRENAEGNLEVYEEIQIEVSKEMPVEEKKSAAKNLSHIPIKDVTKVIGDVISNKVVEGNIKDKKEQTKIVPTEIDKDCNKEPSELKSEVNGIFMKCSELRKSPVVGSFTPMAYHSTPIKEGIPLTKTMVDLQLHPSRHSDNVKKTIEVHTDNIKQKPESQNKIGKDPIEYNKNVPVGNIVMKLETQSPEKIILPIEKKITVEKTSIEKSDGYKKDITPQADTFLSKDLLDDSELVNKVDSISFSKITSEKEENSCKESKKNEIGITFPNKNLCDSDQNEITPHIKDDSNQIELKTETNNSDTEVPRPVNAKIEEDNNKVMCNKIDSPKSSVEVLSIDCSSNISNSSDQFKSNVNEEIVEEENNVTNIINVISPSISEHCTKPSKDIVNNDRELLSVKDNKECHTSGKLIINKVESELTRSELSGDDENIETGNELHSLKESESKDTPVKEEYINKAEQLPQGENHKLSVSLQLQKDSLKLSNVEKVPEPAILNDMKVEEIDKPSEAQYSVKEDLKNKDNNNESVSANIEIVQNADQLSSVTAPINTLKNDVQKPFMRNVVAKKETIESDEKQVDTKELAALKQPSTGHAEKVERPESKSSHILKAEVSSEIRDSTHKECESGSSTIPIKKPCVEEKATTSANTTIEKQETENKDSKLIPAQIVTQNKEPSSNLTKPNIGCKPIDIVPKAVPFGKWTEVNRQAFLVKLKETKLISSNSNGKQIKNSNDLNRRDVLKKIDSQRQSHAIITASKVQDFGSMSRLPIKKEASVFSTKSSDLQNEKQSAITDIPQKKHNPPAPLKEEPPQNPSDIPPDSDITTASANKKPITRKEINNQVLIDKTIEEIINKTGPIKFQDKDDENIGKETVSVTQKEGPEIPLVNDEIEMKMNELHGMPFIERPQEELPRVQIPPLKTYSKAEPQVVIPNQNCKGLIAVDNKTQLKGVTENIIDIDSEEEVIEHEPITGDMDLTKKNSTMPSVAKNVPVSTIPTTESAKKEVIITEKDFDKFVRRNSISYENCITVNFDAKEPHDVVHNVLHKDSNPKTYSKHERVSSDNQIAKKEKHQIAPSKQSKITNKVNTITSDDKNYHSKVKMAYETAMTAKREKESRITIIEDKPVKVVFMENSAEFIPKHLNAQGKDLSPIKKNIPEVDLIATNVNDSFDSEIFEAHDDKLPEDIKMKAKHQRKQVLTPVEASEFEVIEPRDLGIEVSPKKKRKVEEKLEKSPKAVVPKKSYLLGRIGPLNEAAAVPYDPSKKFGKVPMRHEENSVAPKYTPSAIDNLVKAAELLETQSENIGKIKTENLQAVSQTNTPVKRGRGRPRKYPRPEEPVKSNEPSPHKRSKLTEYRGNNKSRYTDEDDSTDDEIIRENWTMGKINENILCPICNKLFRSENVVFKHVKHCTGPSPSRSDSGNKSPRSIGGSHDSENKSRESKSFEMDFIECEITPKVIRKTRKSRDVNPRSINDKQEIIVIEDTPIKSMKEDSKNIESKKTTKIKTSDKLHNLVCEFCNKTFRQLSYLVNHKLQHAKDDAQKNQKETKVEKSVFSCEVCKKDFRKLHHLVQHRIIHNPSTATAKMLRKSSSEKSENILSKEHKTRKLTDDTSAGFRCEPCDKSFRKLHHLVEHRETHDGINRQKNTTTVPAPVEKPPPPPQCEICKKTFRKLHHLIEHKEQHFETSSEKSDDKSIKSSLSTRDIIHECSLCYMVFPNEQALNKHTISCQRKKRQSALKQKPAEGDDEEAATNKADDELVVDHDSEIQIVATEDAAKPKETAPTQEQKSYENIIDSIDTETVIEKPLDLSTESQMPSINTTQVLKPKRISEEIDRDTLKKSNESMEKTKIIDNKEIKDVPKRKTPSKLKPALSPKKRQKPNISTVEKKIVESSDDDEVRYMFNPDYNVEDTAEEKVFMKIRACKRNSLQIERPNYKDLVKRRTSLQNPSKAVRLKSKLTQSKTVPTNIPTLVKNVAKTSKSDLVPSIDSDDSDVKYSFPKSIVDKNDGNISEVQSTKEPLKKPARKTIADKRKSLSTIAKRKLLGKPVSAILKETPLSLNAVKKRRTMVEHRCDCGQLFSSAALLTRHTSLAHTPPRIRRRTELLPADPPLPDAKTIKTDTKPKTNARKPTPKTEDKSMRRRSSDKTDLPKSSVRSTKVRTAAHRGVPVPEKMRKLMEKSKK